MSTEIALIPSQEERTWMKELSAISIKSELLPKAVNTPEKAIIIQMYARAHAIDPMVAFSEIYVVNGKPSMSVKLKMSLVINRIKDAYVQVVESTNTYCKAVGFRPGREKMYYTFTIEQAQKAGLTGKDIWRNYADKMLMWRACGAICDIMFPDVCTMGTAHPDDSEPIKIDPETREESLHKEVLPTAKLRVKPTPAETLAKVLGKKEEIPMPPMPVEECEAQIVEPIPAPPPPKVSFEERLKESQSNFFAKKGE